MSLECFGDGVVVKVFSRAPSISGIFNVICKAVRNMASSSIFVMEPPFILVEPTVETKHMDGNRMRVKIEMSAELCIQYMLIIL